MSFISTYDSASIRGWQSINSSLSYTEVQTLAPANITTPQYFFGESVSISSDGNYVAVGAIEFTSNKAPGQCFVYKRDTGLNTYSLEQQFTPNSFSGNNWYLFGQSIDTNENGNILIIGAPGYDGSPNIGATYIYTRSANTWTEQVRLLSGDANSTFFGRQVRMDDSGTLIAIGSQDDETALQSGAVFIYTGSANTWTNTQKIMGTGAGADFGIRGLALSKDGNYLAAAQEQEANKGAVYIYSKSGNTFSLQQTISAPNTVPNFGAFGRGLSLNKHGNVCVIGSDETSGAFTGNTYIYTREGNTWSFSQRLIASQLQVDDVFGFPVKSNGSGNIVFSTKLGAVVGFENISSYQQFQNIAPNGNVTANKFISSITCNESGSIFAMGVDTISVGNVANVGSVYIFNSFNT